MGLSALASSTYQEGSGNTTELSSVYHETSEYTRGQRRRVGMSIAYEASMGRLTRLVVILLRLALVLLEIRR
jgi:hypothetical protein